MVDCSYGFGFPRWRLIEQFSHCPWWNEPVNFSGRNATYAMCRILFLGESCNMVSHNDVASVLWKVSRTDVARLVP